jgi:iron complex outermembrane recepter protein
LRSLFLTTIPLLVLASPLAAQTAPHDARGDHHAEETREIIVTGIRRNQNDILSGTSVVTALELTRDLKPTIGDTLSKQAGVSATSFGPNASRPVLRGFQGDRVRVLSDGIGSFDVSATSVDHAVAINPLTADRIEVLRGPSALLFGSSAVGGVVNVIDSRIPRTVLGDVLHIDGLATYGSAANERSGTAKLDLPVAGKIVIHVDGSYSKTGNLDTGSFILTPALRAQAAASIDPAIQSLATLKGDLPNSAGRTWNVAGGAALITGNGNLGFSVSRYDSLYGIPVRFSLDPAVAAEQVRLDVKQTRVDLRAEVNPTSGFLDGIHFRAGFADYKHDEIDEAGAVGTTFLNQGWEGRLELIQRKAGGWQGTSGAQFLVRNLNIIGDERFLPTSEAQQYGLFTLQTFDLGLIRAEASARLDHAILAARADDRLGNADLRQTFNAISGSLGASYEFAHRWRLGLNASYTERPPSIEELFANGPHAGTQAFEVGDPGFDKEKSKGLEATLRGSGQDYSVSASLYHSWFNGFIYESPTGAVRDGLPVFQSFQATARHYGAEVEGNMILARSGDWTFNLDGVADFTRATVRGSGRVPRIPALRVLAGIEAKSDMIEARLEAEWVDKQTRLAAFETPTSGYTMVNASLNWKPFGPDSESSLTLSANNVFDVEARRHASFLKDYAPLAGRDVRISARFAF